MSGKDIEQRNIELFREKYKKKDIGFEIIHYFISMCYKKPKPNISGKVSFPSAKFSALYVCSKKDEAQ